MSHAIPVVTPLSRALESDDPASTWEVGESRPSPTGTTQICVQIVSIDMVSLRVGLGVVMGQPLTLMQVHPEDIGRHVIGQKVLVVGVDVDEDH